MLKHSVKRILELGSIYAVTIILLDSFLRSYSILLWIALGVTFVPFSLIILDRLIQLVPKKVVAGRQPAGYGYEDELSRLENLAEKALTYREEEATRLLIQRIRSIALDIAAYKANLQPALMREIADEKPYVASDTATDEQVANIVAGKVRTGNNPQDIEELLSKIESWSS